MNKTIMHSWIPILIPLDLQPESYQGQLTIELEHIVKKYPPDLPDWVWKNALKDALKGTNTKSRNNKWASFVKEHYEPVKSEMGGADIKRVDVLTRLGDLYQKSKSSSNNSSSSSSIHKCS